MAKQITLGRQQAEALVDVLENVDPPNTMLHDITVMQLAAEIRKAFGMVSLATERRRERQKERRQKKRIRLDVRVYSGDFAKFSLVPTLGSYQSWIATPPGWTPGK